MTKIGFDIDGVIADFVTPFCQLVTAEYAVRITEDDIRGHDLWLALGISKDETMRLIRLVLERDDLYLYDGALAGLASLTEAGVEVHIVTARSFDPDEARSLVGSWLASRGVMRDKHYQRIDVATEGSKWSVDASLDAFVDDNLLELIGMAENRPEVSDLILFDHPWNQTADVRHRFTRVHGWDELVETVKRVHHRNAAIV